MSHADLQSSPLDPRIVRRTALLTGAVLTSWLALVLVLGAGGAFVAPPGRPPFPVLIGAAAPIAVFLLALRFVRRFRELVAAADLRLVTAIQAWRFGGLAFLALSAHGVLPGTFAWPAGLGDGAIGGAAPWVVLGLIRHPRFAASRAFVTWNVLGILDLVVAASAGALGAVLAGEVTTGPMSRLPLVLVPGYLVPLFIMLHVTALLRARRLRSEAGERAGSWRIAARGDETPKRVA
jgi:hypothetical protein